MMNISRLMNKKGLWTFLQIILADISAAMVTIVATLSYIVWRFVNWTVFRG